MKIYVCCFFFLTFLITEPSIAQKADGNGKENTVSIRVTAEVASAVKVITIQNIYFKETRPNDKVVKISALRESNAGFLKATGKPNAQVRISWPQQKVIYQADGQGTLVFDYIVAVNTVKEQASADLLLNKGKILNLNNNGELYIWVGGRVDISNAAPGIYKGSFELEIEYI